MSALAVAVAIEGAAANLPAILDALQPARHPDVEFLFASADPADLGGLPAALPNVRRLTAAPGSRIPHLWRDAIVATRADFVALLTAHVVPTDGWLERVRARGLDEGEAAVGGHFVQDDAARPVDWAVYLLRYGAWSRPARGRVAHVAADNALYRRSAVSACADLLPDGFWEPAYHERFRAAGLALALDDAMPVRHVNRYAAGGFAAQRREHGRAFGRERAHRLDTARLLAYVLATPLIPLLLGARVLARAARRRWVGVAPLACYGWLLAFIAHWAWGEARGVFDELLDRTRSIAWPPSRRPSR